jgi:ribonuclease HI
MSEGIVDFEIVVYSDSAYVINCYKQKWYKKWQVNGWINSKKQPVANKELWEQLIPYFENPFFSFEKVAGHADNKYNNLVDEMAVKAKFMEE